jgi:hypothetical protein
MIRRVGPFPRYMSRKEVSNDKVRSGLDLVDILKYLVDYLRYEMDETHTLLYVEPLKIVCYIWNIVLKFQTIAPAMILMATFVFLDIRDGSIRRIQ